MKLRLDAEHDRAVSAVKSRRRKDAIRALLGLVSRTEKAACPYQVLPSHHYFSWVQRAISFETWGADADEALYAAKAVGATLAQLGIKDTASHPVTTVENMIDLLPIWRPASPWSSVPSSLVTMAGAGYGLDFNSSMLCRRAGVLIRKRDVHRGSYEALLHQLFGDESGMGYLTRIQMASTLAPKYEFLDNQSVTKALAQEQVVLPSLPTWSDVASGLRKVGRELEAAEAHRFALNTPCYRKLTRIIGVRLGESFKLNIFDTPLGFRQPFDRGEEVAAFIHTLLNFSKRRFKNTELITCLENLVTKVYHQYSDDGTPKNYQSGLNLQVDRALVEEGIPAMATWWATVDMLMAADRPHEAALAQRHAVPLLSDLISTLAQDFTLHEMFSRIIPIDGPTDANAIIERLQSIISEWPEVSAVTELDPLTPGQTVLSIEPEMSRALPSLPQAKEALYHLARKVGKATSRNVIQHLRACVPEKANDHYQAYYELMLQDHAKGKHTLMLDMDEDIARCPALFDLLFRDADYSGVHGSTVVFESSDAEPNQILQERLGFKILINPCVWSRDELHKSLNYYEVDHIYGTLRGLDSEVHLSAILSSCNEVRQFLRLPKQSKSLG